ncbi:acyl-CoA thioesterase [Amorphus sp. 3PC139-8]|uniref:acyl-CoA thioesterase n=1 Tax=Amorphus sp. 3PC139-8 TaxID=2735676 RepID=UPI00345DB1FC
MTDQFGPEVWRGSVNAWECDQMGHLSARYYLALVRHGLPGFAAAIGLSGAFKETAERTLLVTDLHIRFLREARLSALLHMTAGTVATEADHLVVQFLLWHSGSGELAATMRVRLALIDARGGERLAMPAELTDRADALRIDCPEKAEPRSVTLEPMATRACLAEADRLGLICPSRGAIGAEMCDVFGRLRLEGFLAAITDGMPMVGPALRGDLADYLDIAPERIGGAMVEYRLIYHRYPRAGDRFEVRSGLAGVSERTMRIIHWLLDPETGQPWLSADGVVVSFDLDARKVIAIPPEAQAGMQEVITPGLGV